MLSRRRLAARPPSSFAAFPLSALLLAVLFAAPFAPGCGHAPPPPAPSEGEVASAPLKIGLSVVDVADPRVAAIREAATAAKVRLVVGGTVGGAKTQALQVLELLDQKVAVVLLLPSSPDLLHESLSTVASKAVPLISIGRGDARVGAWVGLKSETLAKEEGDAAGRALKKAGIERPRVLVVESSRWPETTRRIEATLRAMTATCGNLEVVSRLRQCETAGETERVLDEAFARAPVVDVIVAGESGPTAGAWRALQRSALKGRSWVVGVSEETALIDAARAADSRLVLVTWSLADLGTKAIDAAVRASKSGSPPPVVELHAELVGAGVEAPAADGR